MTTTQRRYPLKFRPRLIEKVWGGRRLETVLGKKLPGDAPIGELWGVWDGLKISNGAARGTTLRELVTHDPTLLSATGPVRPDGGEFPLLIKFLDANDNLSIQVHPDDGYAQRVEGVPFGKCEMWYILHAEPGAVVYHGTREALTREQVARALGDGSIVEYLARIEVRPGDVLINPPGTIHALGAGVVLYELQQSCDLTYRLYDWGRAGGATARPLHLDKGADVSLLDPPEVHTIQPVPRDRETVLLCACRYFAAELQTVYRPQVEDGDSSRFEILTALDNGLRLRQDDGTRLDLRAGDSVLLPARLGPFTLTPTGSRARFVRAYVPDLAADIVEPLRNMGVGDDLIVQLGGDPARSDLRGI
ncbi:MAG TPA: type I phosphomannose isomerase catalytic subunit [Chloroflexota bacterium]|nr:type I phosphomannose isomerase catalytic subunit [Chloroflexota bacterium]